MGAVRTALALYWSDYVAHCSHKPGEDSRRRNLLALPRMLVNPSLRAVLLVRLANESPRFTWWFWRNLFVHLHAMDWSGRLEIGPGFELPHPIGIMLLAGSDIGSRVVITHNVTLAGDAKDGRPTLGDDVTLYAGAVVVGGIRIGDRSVVSANCVATRNVPDDRIVTQRGVIPRAAGTRLT